ncbi:thiamine pyrophosphate-binding protein [Gordonia rubripertincta]|uniref:thiamine pyrophosphate-binding protein n=1 Tax=Gordonia rubripertincta TaxID=36822 RepID=UPI0015FA6320|nr:thiamine pyrophosphate-binding protein [Gordonia rubripertincta]QMU20735.1 thiamine pyrophosphate-binding protein [Gordonia rubripertincta]
MTLTADRKHRGGPADTGRTAAPTVAEYTVEQLISSSMSIAFGVHGANIEDLYDAATRAPGMTAIVAKHEFAAGAMADGTARMSGTPGIVMTTSGGGAMNVVPALAEAYDSRVPVLALIGTAPTSLVGGGAFQDMLAPPDTVDIAGVLSAITGSCSVVGHADEVPAALATAFATLHRGLPAAVLLPKDIQAAPAPELRQLHTGEWAQHGADVTGPSLSALAEELSALAESDARLVLWVGEEASRAGVGPQVEALASALGAVVVAAPGGRDLLRDGDGVAGVTGVMGHPSAHRAVADADLCLVLGCRMTMTDRAGLDEPLRRVRLVHLGSEQPRMPGDVDHVRCTDLAAAISQLTGEIRRPRGHDRPREAVAVTHLPVPPGGPGLGMRTAIGEIGRMLPPDTPVFADAGNAGAAAIHHLPFGHGRFVVALGMGGMGYAIAAGVGNAIREAVGSTMTDRQPRRTVVIAGDGAFFMHGMEIHTAVEHDAPVTLVLLNNNAHAMCITRERLFFPDTPSVNRFRPSDLAGGLAAMFDGLVVARASDPAFVRTAAADLLSQSGPNCLVIDADPDEIPPFAPLIPKGQS